MAVTIKGFASDWSVPAGAKPGLDKHLGRYEGTDGVSDDTVPLQAAIDEAATAGRVLRLSRKTYNVSDSIRLPTGLVLNGNGAVIKALPAMNKHVVVNSDATNGNQNIKVNDLRVDGNVENQTSPFSAIYLTRVEHSLFVGIDSQGGRRGIDADRIFGEGMEFVYSNYNTVHGGTFHHNYYDGLKLRTSHYNTFSDIKCYDNARGGVQISYEYPHSNEGVFEAGSNYNTFDNIVVTHSTGTPGGAWVPTTSGLYIHGGSFNTITNFQIHGPGQGIGVWADSSDNTFSNGVIRTRYNGAARASIDMEGGPGLPSHRNTFSDIKIAPLSGADGKYIRVSPGSVGHRFLNVEMQLRDGTGTWAVDDQGTKTTLLDCTKEGEAFGTISSASGSSGVARLSAFSGASGAIPSGWEGRWGQGTATWTEDAGGFLRLVKSANGRSSLANVIAGDFRDVEVMAKVRTDTQGGGLTPMGVTLRGAGAAATETGYFVYFAEVGVVGVTRYANGVSAPALPSTTAVGWAVNTWYWVRARVSNTETGVRISVRVWADGAAEPATWNLDNVDTNAARITAPGWVGVTGFSASTSDFDEYSVKHL